MAATTTTTARTRFACGAGALIALAACGGGGDTTAGDADTTGAGRVVATVRAHYTSDDAVAAGAWVWAGDGGVTWVLVDMQSAMLGVVQARADLWAGDDSGVVRMGRSDVFAAAAEIGAWAFEDITGDGMPDLLGWVADSSGVRYPVFLAGARGSMGDALDLAAPGYRFATDDETAPRVFRGPSGAACALQLWADDPVPDAGAPGWRYLPLRDDRGPGPPSAQAPACP